MSDIKYGLQLFSVRKALEEDLEGTLQKVSEIGYEGVEFFGEAPDTPARLKSLLQENDLECCGWHFWGDPLSLKKEEELKKVVELNQTINNTNIVISSIPEKYRKSRKGWLEMALHFNDIDKKLQNYNLKLGYHNHDFEFKALNEKETPWDILFTKTNQDVIMQLDTGNAYKGGGKVLDILEKFADRAKTIHLKPYSFSQEKEIDDGFKTMIGEDDTPWSEIFDICEKSGVTEWYIVEYETDLYAELEGVERCLNNLKKIRA